MRQHTQLNLWGCLVCGKALPPHRRNACSAECKRVTKSIYDRERYPTVRAETISRACAWQRANRDRKRAYDLERRTRLAAELRKARRQWERANPDKVRELAKQSARARRARKLGLDSRKITPREMRRLLARHNNRCAGCDAQFTDTNPLEWDHIIPISRGGRHAIGNFWPLCRRCNRNKSAKLVVEWRYGVVVSVRDVANLPKAG